MKKGISASIDLSSLAHFILWLIIGYFFPNNYLLAFILSKLWELFEILIVNVDVLYNLTKKYWPIPERYWNEKITNSLLDICFNMSGYYVGSSIRNKYKNKN